MFYKVQVKDHVRVPPKEFSAQTEQAIINRIKKKYDGYISDELGVVIDIATLNEIREGKVIAGDGAIYYDCDFTLLTFKPEIQEVLVGKIRDIADFGAFISIGPIEGMVHVSQTMDDFVSFSKEKVLTGKESGKVLKVGDKCKARLIAVSYKDPTSPKLGLTMRQEQLGKLEWIDEARKKSEAKE